MGIRINTAIGYGVYFGGKNKIIPNFDHIAYEEDKYNLKAADIWQQALDASKDPDKEFGDLSLEIGLRRMRDKDVKNEKSELGDFVNFIGYEEKYLGWLITTSSTKDRYNDSFDYHFFGGLLQDKKAGSSGMKALSVSLYPYIGWVSAISHERLTEAEISALQMECCLAGISPIPFPADLYEMGLIYPDVPTTVTSLAVAAGLMPDEETAKRTMRPYLAWWWA